MKILVIGCGSIGKRHIANLKKLGITNLIICDTDKVILKKVSQKFNIYKIYHDCKKAVLENKDLSAALICSPTSLHIAQALFLAKNKINIFMEKPISHNKQRITKLIKLINKNKLIFMMGMCYRFHPGLKIIKKIIEERTIGKIYSARLWSGHYLPYWHLGEDYKSEYAAKKYLGGGVILTSIHSIDYMRWLFGEVKEVVCIYDKISNLEIDVEDIALFIFRLKNRILVQAYLDFLQRFNEHRIDIVGDKGQIKWDYFENAVNVFEARTKRWRRIRYRFETNDMYVAEMKYFNNCLLRKRSSGIDCLEGEKTLEIVLAAEESMKREKIIKC